MNTWTALAIAVVLLGLNGFFVAAEFALLAARRSRIEQLAAEGDRRANHVLGGLRELTLMLAGAQLGITMCSLGLGAVAEPAVASVIEGVLDDVTDIPTGVSHAIAFVIALSIVVFLHMVVGEMAPKSWAISHPEQSSLRLARAFRLFVFVFRPVIKLLNGFANIVVRAVGVQPQDERAMAHSPADLLFLLKESAGHGDIEADQHDLFTRSLELSGRVAADAMTLRRDIVAVGPDVSADEIAQVAHATGRTRVVVHERDLDHVIGFVHAKDVLLLDDDARITATSSTLARPCMVTPDGHLLEDLLLEMRTERQHLALVIDELGMVVGLVTLEDVIEELIGDFDDETDRRAEECPRLPDGAYVMGGTTRPDEFELWTGVELPSGDWHTLAGFVIDAADEIPSVGDLVETDIASFEVVVMDGYAIDELVVRLRVHDPSA
ncbi:MAG: HlyC/CorC family transporter [Ilumatobacter sp.]|nr:MAG: HlyC/CorC family transporter [Ilumatobacter sp.]